MREGSRDGEKYVGRERESHRADRERLRERWTERKQKKILNKLISIFV